jgi:hypothetical protein
MRRIQTVLATLSLAAFAIVAGTAGGADQAGAPTAAQPAPAPVDGTKITKSRSNIQNNRQAAPPATAPNPASPQSKGVVKTKTKSNQSND